MANTSTKWKEETVSIDGSELSIVRGGEGKPIVIFHGELGDPGRLGWQSDLASSRELIFVRHPGFGISPNIKWLKSIRDLAGLYAQLLRQMGLEGADVIGFSLGGWIAAEMAAANDSIFGKMVLVAPAGIKPPEGEIRDLFVDPPIKYVAASVNDVGKTPEFDNLYGGATTPEQIELLVDAQAGTANLAWQPYMFNPSLPHLLKGVNGLQTTVIWGREDAIIPLSAGTAYEAAIASAKLVVFDDCGHYPEVEQREAFVDQINSSLA